MNLIGKIFSARYLAWIIVALLIALSVITIMYKKEHAEAKREKSNVENLTGQLDSNVKNLELTRKEFNNSKTEWKTKIDSLTEANKTNERKIRELTIANTHYRDTLKIAAKMGNPQIIYVPVKEDTTLDIIVENEPIYRISALVDGKCWWMKGDVISHDPESKLNIIERGGDNSIQIIANGKRFMGFLWWTKKWDFQAYSDCGKVEVTNIKITK